MEARITFSADDLQLEGLLHRSESKDAVVVTHPHPLYGGDMHNPVVAAITDAYQEKGFSTLRFNFRGTGGSAGRHDKGIGERNDVIAAMNYLRENGAQRVDLAGYSFGAWVNAHLSCQSDSIERMVMVSPPIAFIEFTEVDKIDCLALVVTGSLDDIAPMGPVQNAIPGWNPQARFEVIKGADHFYGGYMAALSAILKENL